MGTLAVAGAAAIDAPEAQAALLLDASPTTGTSTSLTGSTPYPVAADASWNRGNSNFGSSLVYSDGSAANGVSVVSDGGTISGGSVTLDFASPTVSHSAGGTVAGPSVFTSDPAKDFTFFGPNPEDDGVAGMRVTGLAPGVYDIYVVAAYTGSTSSRHPGNGSAVQQAVWIFSGGASDTLTYDATTNMLSGTSPTEVTENSVKTWVEGDTYALASVTIDAANPTLYIAASGADSAGVANGDDRPFINFVQVVPEPTSLALIGVVAGGLLARRRRR